MGGAVMGVDGFAHNLIGLLIALEPTLEHKDNDFFHIKVIISARILPFCDTWNKLSHFSSSDLTRSLSRYSLYSLSY
jgi:hypothetical protein